MTTLERSLIDQAERVRAEETGEWVEGEYDVAVQEPGATFPCLLTIEVGAELDSGGERHAGRLLYGTDVELQADDRVRVESRGFGTATWLIEGPPVPIRRSRRLVANRARLRRLEGV